VWKQGEHILVSGATGSGKTELAQKILQERDRRGAHIIVFCLKVKDDATIERSYLNQGYTRYKQWPKRGFPSWERKVVIWPDVSSHKGDYRGILGQQKDVFGTAFAKLLDSGHYTVLFDDGLYLTHPQFMGMSGELGMAHAMGRSGHLTCVTNTQRPSHLPLILYSSADHAFIGATREDSDKKRLAELQSDEPSKELAAKVAAQGKHDFLWVKARAGGPAEPVNLAR
jgi:energy-coupling factor transporter ATP-binding protein EcfA2